MTGSCAVCQAGATQCCSGCHSVFYCSRDHQRQHWKVHKTRCAPYKLSVSAQLGYHVVATRDIRQGETIMKEDPTVLGPKVASLPLCLGCGRRLRVPDGSETYKCRSCGWPLCGAHCEMSSLHVPECNLMKERGFRASIQAKDKTEAAYCSITPLRCLLLQKRDPEKYEAILKLQSHLEERRNTTLYNIFKNNIVGFLRNALGMTEFSEETILKVAAILDTNSFEIRRSDGDIKIRGLYPKAAMLSHDCKPNTKHVFTGTNYTLELVSTVPIKKGEIISVTYTQTLWGTLARREHLKQSKCFDCNCERCSDETELGTYLGSINCSQCKKSGGNKSSMIISTNPLESSSPWKCQVCPHTVLGRQIVWGNDAIRQEIAVLNKSKPQALEGFLNKYKDALHPSNWHMLEVKYALSQLYGNMQGFLLSELPDTLLERKINLCTELLEIADILEPGATRLRGLLLFDLQAAMTVQAKRDLANDKITKAAAQDIMGEAMTLLQQATEVLRTEADMVQLLEDKLANLTKELEFD